MKMYMRNVIIFFLCVLMTAAVFAQKQMENLVPNPGFEEGKDSPDGWIVHHLIAGEWSAYSKAEWATDEVHSGKKSIKVTVTKNPNRTLGWRIPEEKPSPVKGGTKIKVSGWMKTRDMAMGANDYSVPCIVLVSRDSAGKMVKQYWIGRATAPETGWTKYEAEIQLKDNVASVTVSCGLSACNGTAWFDDISIVPLEPPVVPVGFSSVQKISADDTAPIIIPKPWKETYDAARYEIDNPAVVWDALPENAHAKDTLVQFLSEMTGKTVPVFTPGEESSHAGLLVVLATQDSPLFKKYLPTTGKSLNTGDLGPQGYVLAAGNDGKRTCVVLSGTTTQATAYAVQTFRQYPVKSDGRWLIPEGTITDKPCFMLRGLVPGSTGITRIDKWMVPLKVNVIYAIPFRGYKWWETPSDEYKDMLKKWVADCRERFVIPVGGTRPDRGYVRRIKFSDPGDVEAILKTYRDYYECGVRDFHIAFDDGPSQLEYPEDVEMFRNDIARAHLSLSEKIYKTLQKLDTSVTFTVLPLHYYNPLDWSPSQLAYIKTLSKLPADIFFINSAAVTCESALAHQRITGRKALSWDNWATSFEEIVPVPNIFPPPAVKNEPQLPEFVAGYLLPLLDKEMMWYMAADYLWNAGRYDPEESHARAMRKMFGPKLIGSLVEYEKFITANKTLPVKGNTWQERTASGEALITQMEQHRDKLVPLVPADIADNIKQTVENRTAVLRETILPEFKEHPFPITVPATKTQPLINGLPADACWKNALVLKNFRLPLGGSRKIVSAAVQTEVKMLHDSNFLYLLFTCEEPSPERMRARKTERDTEICTDDSVEIMISPATDDPGQPYYHFAVNSLGTFYDAKLHDAAWNGDVSAAAQRGQSSWTAELAIPLASLEVKGRTTGVDLAFNLFRERYAGPKPEFSSWALVERRFHEPERFWVMELKDEGIK